MFHVWCSCWVPEASDPCTGFPRPSSLGMWTSLFTVSQREPMFHGLFSVTPLVFLLEAG